MLKNKLKKKNFIIHLSKKTGFSYSYSKKIINDLVEIIIMNIKEGNLKLKNVGSFKILNKNSRIGRNPITKKEFVITSRKAVSFTISKKISKMLNNLYE